MNPWQKRVSCYLNSINDTSEHVLETQQKKLFLLEIYNRCWDLAVWPWSPSRIVFIRKPNKDRHDDCSSYRPLSIASHFGKLFERMLCNRLNHFVESNNVLANEQEGFRRKRNTVRSLYGLHLNLEHARITRTPTALSNIDLEKAFDSVWIDGILYKLRHYHVDGKIFSIIRTFLKNREAIIELANYLSPAFKIDIGVPQGSVLSPLFFVIFLNDFLKDEPCHEKFADNSAIMIQGINESDISEKLEVSCRGIENWCNKWRMSVNGSKTELILLNLEKKTSLFLS